MTKTSLTAEFIQQATEQLAEANREFARLYPGEPTGRQPVHTMYGGAHLFRSDLAQKLGSIALRSLEEYAPDFGQFGRALGLPGAERLANTAEGLRVTEAAIRGSETTVRRMNPTAWLGHTIYKRVVEKLRTEPVEDLRLDFEDGYGFRPDTEEDGHAAGAAREVARGLADETLPPFLGIRVKPFNEELRERAVRTLDVFLTTLVYETGGKLPPNFVVTLPKVTVPEQVAALADLLGAFEPALGLPRGSLRLEIMIESTQAIIGRDGASMLPRLLDAARGRCLAAHFGAFDYTASCGITAAHQAMIHPACDFARGMMQVAYARTGIWLVDGATSVLPVPVYRAQPGHPLDDDQERENARAVHGAWKRQYKNIHHSLVQGFYQGWDLHPAQLPVRYAAMYSFFLEGLDLAADRLKNFVAKAAQASLVGDVFDDAATGQGLLNFFLRAVNSGAILEEEAARLTTLTPDELQSRSFSTIVHNRDRRG